MKKQNWKWMPHAGHLIVSNDCRFHLNTYVNGYIVSTVGEWWPDRQVREIHAEVHDSKWFAENLHLKGDNFDAAYMKRFGYMEIGMDRTYETMVFEGKKELRKEALCCPFTQSSGSELDMESYSDSVSAFKGHLKMCEKWSKKKTGERMKRNNNGEIMTKTGLRGSILKEVEGAVYQDGAGNDVLISNRVDAIFEAIKASLPKKKDRRSSDATPSIGERQLLGVQMAKRHKLSKLEGWNAYHNALLKVLEGEENG